MRVTIFDYGAGNLHSIAKAVAVNGATPQLVTDPADLLNAEAIVLPGVGSWAPAAARLAGVAPELRTALREGLPCLAICLGMQLLFEQSEEGPGSGVGLFAGRVTRLDAARVPQMGWNAVSGDEPLALAYYANSYVCRAEDESLVTAWSTHERDRFPAAMRTARTLAVQFHPEKSSAAGVAMITRFLDEVSTCV